MPKVRQRLQPLLLFLTVPWKLAYPFLLDLPSFTLFSDLLQINWHKVELLNVAPLAILRGEICRPLAPKPNFIGAVGRSNSLGRADIRLE